MDKSAATHISNKWLDQLVIVLFVSFMDLNLFYVLKIFLLFFPYKEVHICFLKQIFPLFLPLPMYNLKPVKYKLLFSSVQWRSKIVNLSSLILFNYTFLCPKVHSILLQQFIFKKILLEIHTSTNTLYHLLTDTRVYTTHIMFAYICLF